MFHNSREAVMSSQRFLSVVALSISACVPLLSGCVVSQQFYLEDAHVSGPMNQPPVYVTRDMKDGQIRVAPHLSYNTDRLLSGKVPESGDMSSSMKEITWALPEFTFGVGADFVTGQHTAIAAGWNFGVANGQGSWNGYLGIGLFSEGPEVGIRFDAGVQLRALQHDARVMVVTTSGGIFGSSSVDTGYYHDRGTDRALDFYGALTLNTKFDSWPFNVFLNAALTRQSLLDYSPSTWSEFHPYTYVGSMDINVSSRATFLILSPGVYVELGQNSRLLVGARCAIVLDIQDLKPGTSFSPFAQVEFGF
jgi:hypothetical protein